MILLKLSMFLLLTFTPAPIYGQKKMVLIVPRQVRRATAMMAPWRQFNRHPDLLDNEISPSSIRSFNPTPHLQPPHHFANAKARYRLNKNLLPLLSSHLNKLQPTAPGIDDDFNNNGPVNHVLIPHGKGITHALSFGKGYVPHDAITGSSFSSQDSHPTQSVSQLPAIADNSNYNQNYNQNNDLIAERKLEEIKSLILKAKQLGLLSNNNNDEYNSNEKSIMPRDIESNTQNHYGNNNNNDHQGLILRDAIVYDDYNKKIADLAKTWPIHVFNNNNNNNKNLGTINVAEVAAHHGINLPAHLLTHINLNNHGGIINSALLRPNSGYAVNEQVQDIPQDYNRYKPIAEIRPNPTAVATAAAIVATGAQVVPHLGHNQQNSNLNPGYFSLHSPAAIFHK